MDKERTIQDILFDIEEDGMTKKSREELIMYVDSMVKRAYNRGYTSGYEDGIVKSKQ